MEPSLYHKLNFIFLNESQLQDTKFTVHKHKE